jgi:hypothetical protein
MPLDIYTTSEIMTTLVQLKLFMCSENLCKFWLETLSNLVYFDTYTTSENITTHMQLKSSCSQEEEKRRLKYLKRNHTCV